MDARLLRSALIVAIAIISAGAGRPYASVRSQHFIVSAPSQQLAAEICQAAEQFRHDLAVEWLGQELPEWSGLCPIKADVAPNLGAGGATSFVFQGGAPGQWTMNIQGSRERILDSVLPHEITHTIFATHFGRPLPRWADEGACTTVEDESEKSKQDKFLIQFLTSDRGIPFNQMFKMKDYPPDILPLYSQGYSLARFFIQQGGKQKYVQYVGEGMRTNNWTATTQRFYGFKSLSDLQLTWVEWVRSGSRPLQEGRVPETLLTAAGIAPAGAATNDQPPQNALASSRVVGNTQMASLMQQPQSRIPDGALASWQTIQSQNSRAFNSIDPSSIPAAPASYSRSARGQEPAAGSDYSSVSRPVSDGWYAKRRDQTQSTMANRLTDSVSDASAGPPQQKPTTADLSEPIPPPLPQRNIIEAQPLTPAQPANNQAAATTAGSGPGQTHGRVLLEWTRPSAPSSPGSDDIAGVAMNDRATMLR